MGPNGIMISNLKAMGVVVIEGDHIIDTCIHTYMCSNIHIYSCMIEGGKVIGSIEADRLILRGHASVQGDVTCSSVEMGPQSTMIGQMKSVFDPSEAALRSPKKSETVQMGKNGIVFFVLMHSVWCV